MGHITAFESVTLDGVMQGLGRADEDTRGGFTHGGWGEGFADEVSMQFAMEGMGEEGALLFGRRTYDDILGYWSGIGQDNPFTGYLLGTQKYVASRSHAPATHPNTQILVGEAVVTVAKLKAETDLPLTVLGSGELIRSLHAAGLVDTLTLQIHPTLLGSGTRLFGQGDRTDMRLRRSLATTTGVVIAEYDVRHRTNQEAQA
ncbi:MAG: dihydrofolate reductase family protein [Ornithinimicrobium sp.]